MTSILLTNVLGASEYGVYALVFTWLIVLANAANLGLDTLVVRESASLKAKSQFKSLNGLSSFSHKLVLILSIVLALLIAFIFYSYKPFLDSRINEAFTLGTLLIPVWALLMLKSSFLRGLQHIISSEIPLKVLKPALLLLFIIFISVTGTSLTAFQAILINIPAFLLAYAVVHQTLKSRTSSYKTFEPFYKRDMWMKIGISFFLLDNLHMLNSKVDTLMLGAMVPTDMVAIYSIGIKISDLVNVLFAVGITVLGPLVSKLYTESKTALLEKTIKKVMRIIFVLSFIVFLFLVFYGRWVLGFFGEEFPAGYPILIILSVAHLINVALGPVGLIAVMTQYEKKALSLAALRLVVNAILIIVLVPIYGIIGAALSIAISMLLWNVLLWLFCQNKIGIDPSIF